MSTVDNLNQTPDSDENQTPKNSENTENNKNTESIAQFISTRSIPAELEKTLLIDGQEFYINAKKADEAIEAEKVRGRLLLKTTVKENKQNVPKDLLSYNGARNHELEIVSSEGGVFKGPLYAESSIESNTTDTELNESNAVIVAKDFKTLYNRMSSKEHTHDLVGQKTSDGGEIFNDYENNKALSNYSHVIGSSNIAGCKGYHITKISEPKLKDDKLYHIVYTLDMAENDAIEYINGDVCTIRLSNNYDNCGEIFNISNNEVELKLYKTDLALLPTTLTSETEGDKNSFRVPLKPTLGNAVICSTSYASGIGTVASGGYSHAEGCYTNAIGKYSHAEGCGTTAVYAAHAEGNSNKALGQNTHAEGKSTTANGEASHAEGCDTLSSGEQAHAEGWKSEATGPRAHAEGQKTKATGLGAHAEGDSTVAGGNAAHAEGYNTQALGGCSHAEGWGTIAHKDINAQHVQGRWNKPLAFPYVHIVGYGTGDTDRKNIHTLDKDGNAWFSGNVTVGAKNEPLATEEYVHKNVKLSIVKTNDNTITYANFYTGSQEPTSEAPIGSIWIKTEL